MISNVFKNIKNNKKIMLILLVTITICQLVITLIAVGYKNAYEGFIKENNGLNKTSIKLVYNPSINDSSYMSSILNEIDENIHIRIIRNLPLEGVRFQPIVNFEYFKGNIESVPMPIINGDNFVRNDIKNNNKGALVGKEIVDEIKKSQKTKEMKEITVNNVAYNVKGIMGREKYRTEMDGIIVILMNNLDENEKKSVFKDGQFDIILNGNGNEMKVGKEIVEKVKKYDKNVKIEFREIQKNRNIYLNIFGDNEYFKVLLIMTYVLSLISCIYIVNYWIKTMNKKLSIRIAFGSSNRNTILFVLLNILVMSIIATILTVFIIATLNPLLNKYSNIRFGFYIDNIAITFLLSLVNSLIILIFNLYRLFKINPAININRL